MIHRDFHRQRMNLFLRRKLAGNGRAEDESRAPSLTISRQCGSGSSRIGRALVEYLDEIDESAVHGWAYFDQSLVGKVIEEHLLPEKDLPYRPENEKFPIDPELRETLGRPLSEWTLFNYRASTIRHLSSLGNAVLVGRASNFVTADQKNVFHVRLVGSESKRIAYTGNHFQLSSEEAEMLVRKTDRARARFVRRFTGMEVDDPAAYHLILNTDNLPDNVIVRIIGDSLVEWAHESSDHPVTTITFPHVVSD